MKKLPSLLMAAAALGALSAASGATIAAPITYDFTGAISGDQALGGSHVYTAAAAAQHAKQGSSPFGLRSYG